VVALIGREEVGSDTGPPNVPQLYANQAVHARYAVHAHRFFPSGFVSCENKGALVLIPKLKVAGSIPVARSIFPASTHGDKPASQYYHQPASRGSVVMVVSDYCRVDSLLAG